MSELKTNKNFRYSRQREKVLKIIKESDFPITADLIYRKAKNTMPNISLGTVYRNLSTLIDQGLVKKIHFGSTFDRFEANIKPHYHLICESCGKILDFEMPIYDDLNKQAKKLTNFKIQHHKLEFYGVCENCKNG